MHPVIDFKKFDYEIRYAKDLRPVLYQPEALKEDFEAYRMFRDVCLEEDRKKIKDLDLRYDFTVIFPRKIGNEFIKTFGHYHPNSYPEIYQIFEGEALILMQKPAESYDTIEEFIVVKVGEGESVIIPPHYGHVTVNPSDKEIIMSNWVCRSFKSIYDPFSSLRGACYYYTERGWIKNERYSKVPEIKEAESRANELLGIDGDMYSLIKYPKKLEFLVRPEKHEELFKKAFY
uniref:glucose-6-phosphate isomerase n=1 Tax=Geoglobus ahangari TaxID=113653 RepID=A0A7C3UCJ1_9EURY